MRAINTLKSVPVIAIPRRSEFDPSVAWTIAQPSVGEIAGQERLYLIFPMTKDKSKLRPAWDTAFAEIGKRLERGLSVAFITEGDPFVYSTFIYLFNEAPLRWPGIKIEVVPAVTSITAVPAVSRIPVADGQERVAILPASYGTQDLVRILNEFDTTIIMKPGSVRPEVVAALEETGLIDRAIYVSNATTAREKIVKDVRTIRNDKCDYFSMVVVSR